MRTRQSLARWNFNAAALVLGLAVSGCIAPQPVPFQPRTTLAAYGYSEVKVDASHYSLSYSHNTPQGADEFLDLRAAQLAQAAGYRYFEVDDRGRDVLRQKVGSIDYTEVPMHNTTSGGFAIQPRDLVPLNTSAVTNQFYYAWGKVALLTDDQARGNSKALPVNDVLARPATASP